MSADIAHETSFPFERGTPIPVEQNTTRWLMLRMGGTPTDLDDPESEVTRPTGTVQGASFCSISIGVNKCVSPFWGWQYLTTQKHRFKRMDDAAKVLDAHSGLAERCPLHRRLARAFRTSSTEFAEMRAGLTQERTGAVAANAAWEEPCRVLEALCDPAFFQCDREPGQAEPAACRWGHVLEDLAFDWFQRISGLRACESPIWAMGPPRQHDPHRRRRRHLSDEAYARLRDLMPRNFRVSPDGLVNRDSSVEPTVHEFDECLELKCPLYTLPMLRQYDHFMQDIHAREGLPKQGVSIPMEYRVQMIYQMCVTNSPRCHYVMCRFRTRPHTAGIDGRLVLWPPGEADDAGVAFAPPPEQVAQAADFGLRSVDPEPVEYVYAVLYWSRAYWEWMWPYMEAMRQCVETDTPPGWTVSDVKADDPPPPLLIDMPQVHSMTDAARAFRRRNQLKELEKWRRERVLRGGSATEGPALWKRRGPQIDKDTGRSAWRMWTGE